MANGPQGSDRTDPQLHSRELALPVGGPAPRSRLVVLRPRRRRRWSLPAWPSAGAVISNDGGTLDDLVGGRAADDRLASAVRACSPRSWPSAGSVARNGRRMHRWRGVQRARPRRELGTRRDDAVALRQKRQLLSSE